MFEVWNVLTYRDYDFTDDKTGRQVKGRTLHCYRKNHSDGWPGVEYAKMSVSALSDAFDIIPVVGGAYKISFDRRGKIIGLEKVD